MYEGVLLNRDIILDKLIMKDPSLIQQNPILYYIYNLNGTRKTTVEIKNYIKKNTLDQSTTDMLNYWIRISKENDISNKIVQELGNSPEVVI